MELTEQNKLINMIEGKCISIHAHYLIRSRKMGWGL